MCSVLSFLVSPLQAASLYFSATSSLAGFLSDVALSVVCVCVVGGVLSLSGVFVRQGLIAVCIELSVISQHSLPCCPANNQHPLCACSFSLPLFFVSLSLLSHACCHNDKPHSAIVPCCSPRTKEQAISSLREEWWKWRGIENERRDCCEGEMRGRVRENWWAREGSKETTMSLGDLERRGQRWDRKAGGKVWTKIRGGKGLVERQRLCFSVEEQMKSKLSALALVNPVSLFFLLF